MVPSLWGQVSWHNACAPRASASMAQPNKAEDTLRRSTSVKIHMHRNSPPTAVLSCKSLYLWIGPAFDGSSSFFIFAFSIPPYFAARLYLLHPCSFPYSDQPSSNGHIEMSCHADGFVVILQTLGVFLVFGSLHQAGSACLNRPSSRGSNRTGDRQRQSGDPLAWSSALKFS